MQTIVISGINIFSGGPLKVFYDCLDAIVKLGIDKTNKIVLFVHKRELFKDYIGSFDIIELPRSRKFFLWRLYYEYIYFYFYSNANKIDVWFSLHDITPNVKAGSRYVYCHNASIFYQDNLSLDKGVYKYIYTKLYKVLYRTNIKKNKEVIVQQDWIRGEFEKLFGIKNIVVAHPLVDTLCLSNESENGKKIFIYPAFPREFKNFEVICEAAMKINDYYDRFEIWLTIDGTENTYAEDIFLKYKSCECIKFIGAQNFDAIKKIYSKASCLIFPSRLETWGLPISEFKNTGKPMLLANLPYAHETVGDYNKVSFFNCNDSVKLAALIKSLCDGNENYDGNSKNNIRDPFLNGWEELVSRVIMS